MDSTTIAVGKNRLPSAPYHGEKSGIKLHVPCTDKTGIAVILAHDLISDSITLIHWVILRFKVYTHSLDLKKLIKDVYFANWFPLVTGYSLS